MKRLVIDDAIPFLNSRLDGSFDCRIMPGKDITHDDLIDADGVLVRTRTRCNAALLEDTPVSFVATGTIGLDHIDCDYCDAHGIHWQNAPGCNAPAVAQYVWTALLTLGFDPSRMTLGIVGKGNVGSIVAQWGRALGARIIVSDPPRAARGLKDEDYLPLHDLMAQADAVTFHTPLIREKKGDLSPTLHLADAEALSLLKDNAIIINAARGGVVDESALRNLRLHKNLKIAIDTWEGEPGINHDTLQIADIATFHIAGYSRQGKERATRAILEGLSKHFSVSLDTAGLSKPYQMPASLTPQKILESYNILADDKTLRKNPEKFETMRDSYTLREEVK